MNTSKKVTKAIIPVAGIGTRFLPATKAQPKEMLPIVDKPVIQYIVEEAVAAGIEQIIFVTSHNKRAIEDHFDRNYELEHRLEEAGKHDLLEQIKKLSSMASFAYVRQPEPKGDGHAILEAAHLIGDEAVAIMHGDYVIEAHEPGIGQLIKAYEAHPGGVIGVQRVPKELVNRHGIVAGTHVEDGIHTITALVEKPEPKDAPSDLGIKGRYIMTPDVLEALYNVKPGKDGEIRLIEAFAAQLGKNPLYAKEIRGVMYDCGNKLEFVKAQIYFGLQNPEMKDELQKYLETFTK